MTLARHKLSELALPPYWRSKLNSAPIVNSILADQISKLHAFTQKSYTPEQWEKMKK